MVIYKATNTINNKIYIGKTINKFNARKLKHLFDANKGQQNYFCCCKYYIKYKEKEMQENIIYYENCLTGLQKLENESIDSFYADEPFGINFTKMESMYNRNSDKVISGYTEPTNMTYLDFNRKWISGVYDKLKKNGSGWVCSGWTHLGDVLQAVKEAGFTVINHVIWKYQFGVYTKKKFVSSHYHLLFVVKNNKQWCFNKDCRYPDVRTKSGNKNYKDREDVWVIKKPYRTREEKNANTQPIELVEKALSYTTNVGDIILDPFMGGATTAIVCINLNRKFIGFEINTNLKEYIDRRIASNKRNKIGELTK